MLRLNIDDLSKMVMLLIRNNVNLSYRHVSSLNRAIGWLISVRAVISGAIRYFILDAINS
jgi:hypothetical protein